MSTPGSYAFLADPDDTSTAVTTYEARARRHHHRPPHPHVRRTTASRAPMATIAVEVVRSLFEWRQADDCWVRYTVTSLPTAVSWDSARVSLK